MRDNDIDLAGSQRAGADAPGEEVAVSFVVPCYNVAPYVSRCLDSILCQGGPSFEVVCVDDGSCDETSEVLERYRCRDDRVLVIRQDNAGLAAARNAGVKAARGGYISFVDGDDFIAPQFLDCLWKKVAQTGNDLIASPLVAVSERRIGRLRRFWAGAACTVQETERELLGSWLLEGRMPLSACGKLIRRRICLDVPFSPGMYHEDAEVMAAMLFASEGCALVDVPLYGYLMRSGSITHASKPALKQLDDFVAAYTALENQVQELGKCTGKAIVHHRMVTACRFRSLYIRSEHHIYGAAVERELLRRASSAIAELNREEREGLPRSLRLRFELLRRCPSLYDVLFSLYERMKRAI